MAASSRGQRGRKRRRRGFRWRGIHWALALGAVPVVLDPADHAVNILRFVVGR